LGADEEESPEDDNVNVGYKVVDLIVDTYENECSILKDFPSGDLKPQPFVEGARAKLEKVAEAVKSKLGMDFPGAIVQWNEFLATAPQTDDAEAYCAAHPLYVPFKEKLFGILEKDSRYAATASGHHMC
jgi:hypothetical protein